MAKPNPKGGIGSNQYQTMGTPRHQRRTQLAAPSIEAPLSPLEEIVQQERIAAAGLLTGPAPPYSSPAQTLWETMVQTVTDPNADAAALDEVAQVANSLRTEITAHPNASADTLARLASDPYTRVRGHVALHPNTAVDTLRNMNSSETNHSVRVSLMSNPNTPPDILTHRSRSKNIQIRGMVAGNPSTPLETIKRLMADTNDWVGQQATRNPNLPDHLRSISILGQRRRNL